MLIDSFFISFKIITLSAIISLIISLISARFIIEGNIKGKKILETIMLFPMFLPPSAVGYMIIIIMGREGFIGNFLYTNFDISVVFTLVGAVIASIIVSIPIMYQSIKTSLISIDKEFKESARVMGATELQIFLKISLPLSIKGILTGILLSLARSFGEFGATILVAGNIPGKTQTVPMAMYYAIENGDDVKAKTILVIILIISIVLTFFYNKILKRFV